MKKLPAYLLILLSLLFAFDAKAAATYAPGTIGNLYVQCQDAIKLESVDAFYDSKCGKFAANFITQSHMAKQKECKKAVKEMPDFLFGETKRCDFLKKIPSSQMTYENTLYVVRGFFGWVEWLQDNEPSTLNEPIADNIKKAVTPGPFCEHLKDTLLKGVVFFPSRSLSQADPEAWLEFDPPEKSCGESG